MTAPDPLGPVVITSRDIYDALVRLTDTVNRLVDKGDGHTEDIRDHEARLRTLEEANAGKRLGDLDTRMRSVEAGRWPLPALSALLALAALALAAIPLLSHH